VTLPVSALKLNIYSAHELECRHDRMKNSPPYVSSRKPLLPDFRHCVSAMTSSSTDWSHKWKSCSNMQVWKHSESARDRLLPVSLAIPCTRIPYDVRAYERQHAMHDTHHAHEQAYEHAHGRTSARTTARAHAPPHRARVHPRHACTNACPMCTHTPHEGSWMRVRVTREVALTRLE